mgnify:CR=1 FL=1
MTTTEIAVLGVGMHKWGKFPGKTFVDIGVEAARNAQADPGNQTEEIQYRTGDTTVRNAKPGSLSATTYAKVVNKSGSTTNVQVILTYVQIEA